MNGGETEMQRIILPLDPIITHTAKVIGQQMFLSRGLGISPSTDFGLSGIRNDLHNHENLGSQ